VRRAADPFEQPVFHERQALAVGEAIGILVRAAAETDRLAGRRASFKIEAIGLPTGDDTP
jgi:hypothetical protein